MSRSSTFSGDRRGIFSATVDEVPDLLPFLLSADPSVTPPADALDADRRHRALGFDAPIDAAAAGGFVSDRLGYAFLAGYQAALRALLPDHAGTARIALCATEAGGGHPAAIRTTLRSNGGLVLDGDKTFVTFGTAAQRLIVIATTGRAESGHSALRAVVLPADRPGIRITDRPALPFTPEIPHAELSLTAVPVEPGEVLPGDGYLRYLKPFRTVEDLHVQAALLGWLIGLARRSDWPPDWLERALAALAGIRDLAGADPSAPATHLAVAGAFATIGRLIEDAGELWDRVDRPTRDRWLRDRRLLTVADTVRGKRTEAAWRALHSSAPAAREPGAAGAPATR